MVPLFMGDATLFQRVHRFDLMGVRSGLGGDSNAKRHRVAPPLEPTKLRTLSQPHVVIMPIVALAHWVRLSPKDGWILYPVVLVAAFALGSALDHFISRPCNKMLLVRLNALRPRSASL